MSKTRVAFACLLCLCLAAAAEARRVVAVADIHGGLDEVLSVLQAAELIDEDRNWVGGDAVLVQTGDVFDRGAEVREVVELLQKLQRQASEQGGEVIALMGNHEAMNLLRITRDVNPDVYAHFVDEHSEQRRLETYQDYVRWARQRARYLQQRRPNFNPATREQWLEAHPPGYLEYLDALDPEGWLGRWVRSLPGTVQVAGGVFLHGGFHPSMTTMTGDEVNARIRTEIERFDRCRKQLVADGVIHETADTMEMIDEGLREVEFLLERLNQRLPEAVADRYRTSLTVLRECVDYRDWYLVSPDGPLWFREFARWTPEEGSEKIARMLESRGARFFVVGHTPQQSGRVEPRFDSRVFLLDTGMLQSHYGGTPAALEIDGESFTAIYPDRRVPLPAPSAAEVGVSRRWRGPDGESLPFLSDEQVLAFLQTAEVVSREVIPVGVTRPSKLLLEKDGVQAHAVFRQVDEEKKQHRTSDGRFLPRFRDSYRYEVAAYRMAELLGIDRIPPVVLRKLDNVQGSVQLWLEGMITERKRREQGLEPAAPLRWTRQRGQMQVFDHLIQNIDRNQGNILIDPESWDIWWIDHSRAFVETVEIPGLEEHARIERGMWQGLQELEQAELLEAMSGVLTTFEVETLWKRAITMREYFAQLIEQRGEQLVVYDLVEPETAAAAESSP